MALELKGQKRVGGASLRTSGKNLSYEERYQYLIESDSKATTRLDVILSTPGLPQVNVTRSAAGFAVCKSVDAERDGQNAFWWHATATFSTDVQEDTSGANGQSGDPTVWVPIAELGLETYTEASFVDADGDAIKNSANDPFAGGITLTRTLTQYNFTQFEPDTTTDDDIAERNETVNATSFKGKAAKTLRLTIREATLGFYFGYRVWRIGYTLTYKPDTWQWKILDRGGWYIDTGVRKPFLDDDGNRIIGPLDGSGSKQTVGSAPAVLTFDKYSTLEFNDFLRVT